MDRDLFHLPRLHVVLNWKQIQLNTVNNLGSWPGIYRFECLFSHNYLYSIHMDELHAVPEGRSPLDHPCFYTHVLLVPDIGLWFSHGPHSYEQLHSNSAFHHPLRALRCGLLVLTIIILQQHAINRQTALSPDVTNPARIAAATLCGSNVTHVK